MQPTQGSKHSQFTREHEAVGPTEVARSLEEKNAKCISLVKYYAQLGDRETARELYAFNKAMTERCDPSIVFPPFPVVFKI